MVLSMDGYVEVFHMLPYGERKMPIVVHNGVVWSWRDVFHKVMKDEKKAVPLLKKISKTLDI